MPVGGGRRQQTVSGMRGVCFERADMIYESLPTTRLSTRGSTLPPPCHLPAETFPPPESAVQDLPSLRDLSPAKLGRFIIGRANAYAGMRRLSPFIDPSPFTRAVYASRNPSILPSIDRAIRARTTPGLRSFLPTDLLISPISTFHFS